MYHANSPPVRRWRINISILRYDFLPLPRPPNLPIVSHVLVRVVGVISRLLDEPPTSSGLVATRRLIIDTDAVLISWHFYPLHNPGAFTIYCGIATIEPTTMIFESNHVALSLTYASNKDTRENGAKVMHKIDKLKHGDGVGCQIFSQLST